MPGNPATQVFDGHPVYPRRAAVHLDPLIRAVQVRGAAHHFHQVPCQGSFLVPYRGRLWRLECLGSGSAFAVDTVAQRRLQGLVEKVPLVHAGLPPLHVHRMLQTAPWLSNSALHPVVWATMASADFSPLAGGRLRPPAPVARRNKEISQGKTLLLHSTAAGCTCVVSVKPLGFSIGGRIAPPHRPCIRFLFVSSEFCLRLPPHPTSR